MIKDQYNNHPWTFGGYNSKYNTSYEDIDIIKIIYNKSNLKPHYYCPTCNYEFSRDIILKITHCGHFRSFKCLKCQKNLKLGHYSLKTKFISAKDIEQNEKYFHRIRYRIFKDNIYDNYYLFITSTDPNIEEFIKDKEIDKYDNNEIKEWFYKEIENNKNK